MTREQEAADYYADQVEDRIRTSVLTALPGYPFLPCPICHGVEGCDHTVRERACTTHPAFFSETVHTEGVLAMRKAIQIIAADGIAGVIVLCDDGTLAALQPEYGADLKVIRWVWKSFPNLPQIDDKVSG